RAHALLDAAHALDRAFVAGALGGRDAGAAVLAAGGVEIGVGGRIVAREVAVVVGAVAGLDGEGAAAARARPAVARRRRREGAVVLAAGGVDVAEQRIVLEGVDARRVDALVDLAHAGAAAAGHALVDRAGQAARERASAAVGEVLVVVGRAVALEGVG